MIAALQSNDTILMSILSIIYVSNDNDVIDKFLHHKNDANKSILKLVIAQGSRLSIHCELLNKMEQDFHRSSSTPQLDQCLKDNIGPHKVAEKSIKREDDNKEQKDCLKKLLIVLFLMAGPLVKLAIVNFDIGTDVWLAIDYYEEKGNHTNIQIECQEDHLNATETDGNLDFEDCDSNPSYVNEWIEIPSELSTEAAFNYSLAFLLLPILSYLMEWIYNKGPDYLKNFNYKVRLKSIYLIEKQAIIIGFF